MRAEHALAMRHLTWGTPGLSPQDTSTFSATESPHVPGAGDLGSPARDSPHATNWANHATWPSWVGERCQPGSTQSPQLEL